MLAQLARLVGITGVALFFCGCSWCTHPAPRPDKPFTIVYSTAVTGNLEPCGCSADQRGGLARAAAAVDQIRKEGHDVLLIDGGDRFFPATPIPTDALVLSQQRRQAAAMANVTKAMGYGALAYSARDQRGEPSLFDGLPMLDTGDDARPFTTATRLVTEQGARVGVFAVGEGPDALSLIRTRATSLHDQGAQVIVLLAYRTFERAKELLPTAKEAGVSLVLAGRADVPETHDSAALPDSQPPLFTAQARGQALLRLDVLPGGAPGQPFVKVTGQGERDAELDAIQQRIDLLRRDATSLAPTDPMAKLKTDKLLELEGRKAKLASAPPPTPPADRNSFTYAFIPMTPSLPDAPTVRKLIDDYSHVNAEQNLTFAKAHPKSCPAAAPGQASYVGAESCRECHEDAYKFWLTTPHSHAYQALVTKDKQYDVSCIGCHVLGYEKPGGACDIAQTAHRENVQCEACHGPGSSHAESSDEADIRREVPETTCRACHDPENSTHFNYVTYRSQIIGPGHGM